jgi:hypothetical protein
VPLPAEDDDDDEDKDESATQPVWRERLDRRMHGKRRRRR